MGSITRDRKHFRFQIENFRFKMSDLRCQISDVGFGLVGVSAPTDWLVRLLAVAGGAAVGVLLVSLVVGAMRRFLGVRKVPGPLYLVVRLLGAVAAGWLVWLLVFGGGGSGLGGPGGSSTGGQPGTGKGTGQDKQRTTQPAPDKGGDALKIVMLGGRRVGTGAQGKRFYRLADEKESLDFDELKALILKRKTAGLQAIAILIYGNSVSKDHSAVTRLKQWAEDHGLMVTVSFPMGEG
jgi:hypothetical protein